MTENRNSPESVAIGVDVGGTKIAFTAADQNGNTFTEFAIDTRTDGDEADNISVSVMIGRIAEGIHRALQESGRPAVGIGIAFPGPVDTKTGVLINAANLGWKNVPVRELLQAQLNLDIPIWLQNDV